MTSTLDEARITAENYQKFLLVEVPLTLTIPIPSAVATASTACNSLSNGVFLLLVFSPLLFLSFFFVLSPLFHFLVLVIVLFRRP